MSPTRHLPSLILLTCSAVMAQAPAPGLRLYAPFGTFDTYLIDTNDQVVHTWTDTNTVGASVYLEDDGTMLRTVFLPGGPRVGGAAGGLRRFALDGTKTWDFRRGDLTTWSHHDVAPMPNGNVLMTVWERLTAADAIAAGRNPLLLGSNDWLPDAVIEVQQTGPTSGTVVWEWRVMDHVVQDFDPTQSNFGVVASHPELIDVNYPQVILGDGEFNHINSIDYDPKNDVILLGTPFQNEIWIIDHSTTTAEAAGHTGGNHGRGGDLLYRWGNPQAYRRGTPADQQLYFQHGAEFIQPGRPGAGNVILFNNRAGALQGQSYSSAVEIVLPATFQLPAGQAFGPVAPVWEYTDPIPSDLYSPIVSSAERLPNGNTLICSGFQAGYTFEVDPAGNKVWEYLPTLPYPNLTFQASYVGDHMLWTDSTEWSVANGGTITFDLIVGSPFAGRFYVLLGSASGTTPGFPLGAVNLPLNFDGYLETTINLANVAPFGNTIGTLDANGRATATFSLPGGLLPPAAVGTELHHAFVLFDAGVVNIERASNAVPMVWVP
ncbi:MAG: aryl-sulfate sulfotransferase [Planctomycetes bacterium]|nr:aryl-sulfate sulfotransferase [Planctomycetota bacterium]